MSVKKINVTRRWEIYQQAQQLKQQLLEVLGFDVNNWGQYESFYDDEFVFLEMT